jgi:glycosyltransferase involved in cell wall biosynthesis
MLSQRLYYTFKPYVPWGVRMAMRRIAAARKRRNNAATWPILESAGKPPADWAGWPGNKQFAVVLTHDIEGPGGLAKVRKLAELEMSLGFRSSFNFIPEGSYSVPPQLRDWLIRNGFEVGVHDLQHDGKLYRSRASFEDKAARINEYVRDWNAQGFRSGFMLRNLEWIHQLNVRYDSSTFDTDPFEPQPEAAGTIFPFWIPSPDGSSRPGYVELPYTLPQDSTLFLLLAERSPAIWIRKLDWLAARGGMALVNVHPDYIRFEGDGADAKTFPVGFYTEFLQHVRQRYEGAYTNFRAEEVAKLVRERLEPKVAATHHVLTQPVSALNDPLTLRGRRAAVLLYSDFPADPRPRRAAQAMVDAGMEVDVFCLSEQDEEPIREVVHGVNVFRLRMKRRREGVGNYIWLYSRFITASFLFLLRRSFGRRYDVVHVHNMPDILVFAAMIPKLLGARVILDLHDPMPELMTTIFGVDDRSPKIRLLKLLEKLSLGFADSIITVNRTCRRIFSTRSCEAGKIHVVMNSPDETIFRDRECSPVNPPSVGPRPFVLMYHGSLVERHGLDLAVAAVAKLRPQIPGIELRVFGKRTPYLDKVMAAVEASNVREVVHYFGAKDLEQIAQAIGACDVGIIPNRRSVFTELNTPTRIFEYLSQSKPVIAPRAQGILDYFGPSDLVYFELGDVDDLAAKILYTYQEPGAVIESLRRGREIFHKHCWQEERRRFLELTARLLSGRRGLPRVALSSRGTSEQGIG